MNIGVANKEGVFQVLPQLLSSLPNVRAEHFQPFGDYDATVGFEKYGVRNIQFDPEKEVLDNLRYPATISYMEKMPLKMDRVVCSSTPQLMRRYESLIARAGRLVVDQPIYAETRTLLHPSIPVEFGIPSSGIRIVLGSDYNAKIEMLTAMAQCQPVLAIQSDASESIIRAIRCPYPWMIPFNGIMDAVSKMELLMNTQNLQASLEDIRKRCLAERLHSRFVHLWAEVLFG